MNALDNIPLQDKYDIKILVLDTLRKAVEEEKTLEEAISKFTELVSEL